MVLIFRWFLSSGFYGRHNFLAAQIHLCDSTFPRPLLPRSRGPPTLRNECIALQPHLAPPTLPGHLYVCHTTSPSVCQSTCKSVALSIHNMTSPSVIPVHLSYDKSVHHPINSSMTRQSVTPPISPTIHPSDSPSLSDHLYTILPHPSGCPTSSVHSSPIYTSPSDCPSPPNHLYVVEFWGLPP